MMTTSIRFAVLAVVLMALVGCSGSAGPDTTQPDTTQPGGAPGSDISAKDFEDGTLEGDGFKVEQGGAPDEAEEKSEEEEEGGGAPYSGQ